MDADKGHHSPGREVSKPATAETELNDMADIQSKAGTPGLLDIAAELRNTIYELVFTSNLEDCVDLFAATPPSRAITLACRQTRNEAKQMYTKAYRDYWTHATFYIDYDLEHRINRTTVDNLNPEDLVEIRNVHLKMHLTTLVNVLGTDLAEKLAKGGSDVLFARHADGRWWLVTGCDDGDERSVCWEIYDGHSQPGYSKCKKTDVFRPISVDELSATVGRTLPATYALIDQARRGRWYRASG
ncbi:hypothetical protein LTR27_006627 [Elasticomyces elasticus]|nr:hypothetical protein LTR27_006627 [Elasticomyces elasticus]